MFSQPSDNHMFLMPHFNHFSKNVADYSASREKNDLGFLTFDLEADLTSVFNWNAKQLFLYLVAEYQTPKNVLNQVVLWDKIILRGENAKIDVKSINTKYYFWDDGNGLKWVVGRVRRWLMISEQIDEQKCTTGSDQSNCSHFWEWSLILCCLIVMNHDANDNGSLA